MGSESSAGWADPPGPKGRGDPAGTPSGSHPRTPTALVVLGPAGSGKSHLAKHLASELRAAYLDKDTLFRRFVEATLLARGLSPAGREDSEVYRTELLPLEYASLLDAAGENLRLGLPVVLDAPFSAQIDDPRFIVETIGAYDWPVATDVVVVRLTTPAPVVRTRLIERGLARDDRKLAHWADFWRDHGERTCAWDGVRHLTCPNETAADLDRLLTQVRETAPNP